MAEMSKVGGEGSGRKNGTLVAMKWVCPSKSWDHAHP